MLNSMLTIFLYQKLILLKSAFEQANKQVIAIHLHCVNYLQQNIFFGVMITPVALGHNFSLSVSLHNGSFWDIVFGGVLLAAVIYVVVSFFTWALRLIVGLVAGKFNNQLKLVLQGWFCPPVALCFLISGLLLHGWFYLFGADSFVLINLIPLYKFEVLIALAVYVVIGYVLRNLLISNLRSFKVVSVIYQYIFVGFLVCYLYWDAIILLAAGFMPTMYCNTSQPDNNAPVNPAVDPPVNQAAQVANAIPLHARTDGIVLGTGEPAPGSLQIIFERVNRARNTDITLLEDEVRERGRLWDIHHRHHIPSVVEGATRPMTWPEFFHSRIDWLLMFPRETIAIVSRDFGSAAGFGVGVVSLTTTIFGLTRGYVARSIVMFARRIHQHNSMLIRTSSRFASINNVYALINRRVSSWVLPTPVMPARDLLEELRFTVAVSDWQGSRRFPNRIVRGLFYAQFLTAMVTSSVVTLYLLKTGEAPTVLVNNALTILTKK